MVRNGHVQQQQVVALRCMLLHTLYHMKNQYDVQYILIWARARFSREKKHVNLPMVFTERVIIKKLREHK